MPPSALWPCQLRAWPQPAVAMLPLPQGIPAGAEACISYGCTHKDSLALMRDYGFVQPGNVNDRVAFSAGMCVV